MTIRSGRGSPPVKGGFTLIEVVGAILIFAAGVLLAAQLSTVLSTQIRDSALRSAVVTSGQEILDSLSTQDYSDLATGTEADTLRVSGGTFERTVTITQSSDRVREITVIFLPLGFGPAFSATTYVSRPW